MADPAFDAFSQGRNTGTKDRVTERRRVDTYTDPNRYQMPPRRRLGVHASNKSMFVTPEKEDITAFAEGLAKVQPKIMDYLTTKQAAENQKQIEYGKLDAMGIAAAEAGDPEFADNEWRKFGYQQQKAFLAGERLATQFTQDASTRDLRGQDFDAWANDWWKQANKENPQLATLDPEVMESFYKPFNKAAIAARSKDMVEVDNLKTKDQKNSTQEYINEAVDELVKEGAFTMDRWLAIKDDQQLLSRWDNTDMDEFFYNTVARLVQDNHFVGNGLDMLTIFREKRLDSKTGQTIPSLYSNPDWRVEIEKLEDEVVRKAESKRSAITTRKNELKSYSNSIDTDNETKIRAQVGYVPYTTGKAAAYIDPEYSAKAENMEIEIVDLYHEKKRELTNSLFTSEEQIDEASAKALEYALVTAGKQNYYSPGYVEYMKDKAALASQRNSSLKNLITVPANRQLLAKWYNNMDDVDADLVSEFTSEEKGILMEAGRAQHIQNLRIRDKVEEANTKAIDNQIKTDKATNNKKQ